MNAKNKTGDAGDISKDIEFGRGAASPVALQKQVGGTHYKDMPIQPVEFIHANGIGFIEGCVIKYVCRHRAKNGAEDINKAIHFLSLLRDLEYSEHEITTS